MDDTLFKRISEQCEFSETIGDRTTSVRTTDLRAMIAWINRLHTLYRRDEYHEDSGAVIWWKLPITEPPYVGSALDSDFPDDVTHWSFLPTPVEK